MKILEKLGKKAAMSLTFAALIILSGFKMSPAALAYVVPGLVGTFGFLAGSHAYTDVAATKTTVKVEEKEESS
jgi:hypothetical protein